MKSNRTSLTSLELFTGAGGLALATHSAGFNHLGLYEWNRDACETLRANSLRKAVPGLSKWKDVVVEGDVAIADFSLEASVDLVAGGPPCQPFSLGGKHAGMEDQRDMIPHFIRAVQEVAPRAFIMENVRGLVRKSFSTYLDFSLLQLAYPKFQRRKNESWQSHHARLVSCREKGVVPTYHVFHKVLNAADYGVPQSRERIFVVGFRNDLNVSDWSFPECTHSREALFFDQWVSGEYWIRHGMKKPIIPESIKSKVEKLSLKERPNLKAWVTIRDSIADLPDPFVDYDHDEDEGIYNHRYQAGAKPYPGHTGSPLDQPSKTLKAGGHGVPGGENMIAFPDGTYRYLTIREAGRVQTFPDNWKFEGSWSEAMRQLGNAVPVKLAEAVAKKVKKTLLADHP